MLRDFIVDDFYASEDSYPAMEYAKRHILSVQQGGLNEAACLAAVESAAKEFLRRILSANKARKVDALIQQLCHEIIKQALQCKSEVFSLTFKRLALMCAIIVDDAAKIAVVIKTKSQEESACIDRTLHAFVDQPEHLPSCEKLDSYLNENYQAIAELLQNIPLCMRLLHDLEKQLAEKYQEAGVNLSVYHSSAEHYVFLNHPWPILDNIEKHVSTRNILNKILLRTEHKHGINLHEDAPAIFAGFVADDIAKQHIKNGELFVEYNYIGNLLHGKYTHRLQWYIVFTAIEKGLIKINASSKNLFCMSGIHWSYLFDRYGACYSNQVAGDKHGFRSPFYFHSSLLLMTKELPCLSGTLRKIFSRSIQILVSEQREPTSFAKICAEYDFRGGRFESLYSDIPVKEYYQRRLKQDTIQFSHQEKYGESGSVFFRKRLEKTDDKTASGNKRMQPMLVSKY